MDKSAYDIMTDSFGKPATEKMTEAQVIAEYGSSAGNELTRDGLVEVNHLHGGLQAVYHFANGYGASVVRHRYSYGGEEGLWEMAVLKLSHEGWSLTYDTPITEDVIGNLRPSEVDDLLVSIKEL